MVSWHGVHTYVVELPLFAHLGIDHHQLIMPPISKDCSNTFLERSFIYVCYMRMEKNLVNISEHQILIVSGRVLKQCYLHNNYGC